jgi:alpha-L-rhamnosidase
MLPLTVIAASLMILVPVGAQLRAEVPQGQHGVVAAASFFQLVDTRVEGIRAPLGIEEAAPRFSWRYEASAAAPRGFRQAQYRVQVASSAEKLAKGEADLWDSGKQSGSDTLNVLYAGKPLASATRYFWQVTGFDKEGKAYAGEPQYFETGLLKAEDWGGAQWIGAKDARPKTIPANLQRLTDYSFETRFRILEGSAICEFRASYAWHKGYGIEIQPGTPGKFIVTCKKGDKKEVLKEYPLVSCAENQWHGLRVVLKGADFSFWIDEVPVNNEPLHDETSKEGTISLGALAPDGKKGLVQFDDFKLTVNGETLVQEAFDNPALFAFQDCFFSNKSYSKVKEGVLEVRALNVFVEPKEGLAAPLFRKAFSTAPNKKITRARAYVAGLGYYTFWLNGKRLDDYLLQPGWARYNKTAYYTVYDLTEHLGQQNVLGFELGRGWYAITTPTLCGATFYPDWMAEPALRTLVTIDYADGTRETVASDPSFKTAPGPILFDSVKAGEIQDARKEQPGWNLVGFDDQKWSPAVIAKGAMPSAAPGLTAQLFEPIRAVETLSPKSIDKIEDEEDAWLVDFGRNMAGTVALQLKTEPGQKLRVAYVERERALFGAERWNNFNPQDTGSYQTDIFIAKGGAKETFEPRYSYNGFRYIRLEGLKEKPSPDQITAKVFNSDMVSVGEFQSSSELWNKIWKAGKASIQSNMHSIPTDCPTFEKQGWTCDDASPFYAMAYNFDLRKLYEKRLQDYADDISPDGKIRDILPSTWGKGQDPAWSGSYVNIAWKHYQTYGDRRMLERHYDNLKLYMGTLIKEGETSEKPPLLTKPRVGYGDWVHPDGGNCPPEGALIYYNLYFYKYARQMAEMAKVIGRTEDEKFYTTLAADLKKRFNEYHFDEKDGFYYSTNRAPGVRQSPQAIALAFGLVPEEKIGGLVDRLVEDIQQHRKGHFWVGILGMEAIADTLSENGRADVAYASHLKEDGPSLGNMIREGATTIWEDYSLNRVRSMNHKMFTTPLGWMARYVAGLRVDGILGGGPGFREALIDPHPCPEQVKFARMEYDSPVGRYESGWRVTPEGMAYEIVVPPNATATFRLPLLGQKEATVSESGKILWKNGKPAASDSGISTRAEEKDRLVMTLGSGTYSFLVKNPSAGATK